MVFRLFVPPGEGQHNVVPKRPDPLGANATLQSSVLGSTAVAAAYTSFATRYGRRVAPGLAHNRVVLFVRCSAKLGLWASVVGATANWAYHSRFASVVVSQQHEVVKPWKLYEKANSFTVDDGCLVGAGLGLVASIPALFTRRLVRPDLPRWAMCFGLANIGASVGIISTHGYLQYIGERQKAYVRLERRLKRRSLEFWGLFQDKTAMAQFNPLTQLYIRHNVLWYSQQLPEPAFNRSEESATGHSNSYDNTSGYSYMQEDQSFYLPPFDYADDLKHVNVEATYTKLKEHEAEIAALLKEAEFILFICAHRQYEYCNLKNVDDEERRQRLEELQLLQITYNKIRSATEQLQSRIIVWRISLQHKAILDSATSATSPVTAWLPQTTYDFTKHNPSLSIQELEKTQATLIDETRSFEASIAYPGHSSERKRRWRADLEDGRSLLRVADKLIWEFEKMQAAQAKDTSDSVKDKSGSVEAVVAPVVPERHDPSATKSSSGNLEPGS